MRELRNYGDEVAREITSRGGVEGSLSQEHFFEDLMKLVRITEFCTIVAYCCGFSTLFLTVYIPHLDDFTNMSLLPPSPSWETCTEMILTISVWSSGGPGPIHPGLSTFHIPYSHVSIPVHFIANFTSLSFILPCFHQLTQHFCTFSCLLISMIPFIHVSILSCLHSSGPTSVESVSTSSWVCVPICSRLPCSAPSYTS